MEVVGKGGVTLCASRQPEKICSKRNSIEKGCCGSCFRLQRAFSLLVYALIYCKGTVARSSQSF